MKGHQAGAARRVHVWYSASRRLRWTWTPLPGPPPSPFRPCSFVATNANGSSLTTPTRDSISSRTVSPPLPAASASVGRPILRRHGTIRSDSFSTWTRAAAATRLWITPSSKVPPFPTMTKASETRRHFQTESEYHTVADETLEDIQDAVEGALENARLEEFEVVFASGVLTMTLPPHGTWVLNKQTPNRQIWWSSPLSGPRRYEHEDGEWVFTRDDSHSMTLKEAIADEVFQIYQIKLDLE